MDNKNSVTNSPLKTLLNKPFSLGSPPYTSYGVGKVRLHHVCDKFH